MEDSVRLGLKTGLRGYEETKIFIEPIKSLWRRGKMLVTLRVGAWMEGEGGN